MVIIVAAAVEIRHTDIPLDMDSLGPTDNLSVLGQIEREINKFDRSSVVASVPIVVSTLDVVCLVEKTSDDSRNHSLNSVGPGVLRLVKLSDVHYGAEFVRRTPAKKAKAKPVCCDIDDLLLPAAPTGSGLGTTAVTGLVIKFAHSEFRFRLDVGVDADADADMGDSCGASAAALALEMYRQFVQRRAACVSAVEGAMRVQALLRDLHETHHRPTGAMPSLPGQVPDPLLLPPPQPLPQSLATPVPAAVTTFRSEPEHALLRYFEAAVGDCKSSDGGGFRANSVRPSLQLLSCFYCGRRCADGTDAQGDPVVPLAVPAAATHSAIGIAPGISRGGRGNYKSGRGKGRGRVRGKDKGNGAGHDHDRGYLAAAEALGYRRFCLDSARRSDTSDTDAGAAGVDSIAPLPSIGANSFAVHPYVPRDASGGFVVLCGGCWRSFLHFRSEAVGGIGSGSSGSGALTVPGAKSHTLDTVSGTASATDSGSGPSSDPDAQFESPFTNSAALILPQETNEEICAACSVVPKELLLCSSCVRAYCHRCVRQLLPATEARELFGARADADWSCTCCKWDAVFQAQARAAVFGGDLKGGAGRMVGAGAGVAVGGKKRTKADLDVGPGLGSEVDDEDCHVIFTAGSGAKQQRQKQQQKPGQVQLLGDARGSDSSSSSSSSSGSGSSTAAATFLPAVVLPPVNKEVGEGYYFGQYVLLLLAGIRKAQQAQEAVLHSATSSSPAQALMKTKSRSGAKAQLVAMGEAVNETEAEEQQTEDFCFLCKDGGDLVECDSGRPEEKRGKAARRGRERCWGGHPVLGHCRKVYHAYCLEFSLKIRLPEPAALESEEEEVEWRCPRHYCSVCALHMTARARPGVRGKHGSPSPNGSPGPSSGRGPDNPQPLLTYFMCQYCPISVCSRCCMEPPYRLTQLRGEQQYALARTGGVQATESVQMEQLGRARGCAAEVRVQPIICHDCLKMMQLCVRKGDIDAPIVANEVMDGKVRNFPQLK